MGYAAVKGGLDAIQAATRLVTATRTQGDAPPLGLDTLRQRLRLLLDRVQGDAGLWGPELAARAVRQAEGDIADATALLRSHRSTLPRLGRALTASMDDLRIRRRIVPAYRTPPGLQVLGATPDYTPRLIDLDEPMGGWTAPPGDEPSDVEPLGVASTSTPGAGAAARELDEDDLHPPHRLLDLLRKQDLLVDRRGGDDPEPVDVTRTAVRFPTERSARLALLARGETSALVTHWYRGVRGEKSYFHEITLGEVRVGRLPVRVAHPDGGAPVTLGEVDVTEVEAYEDVHGDHEHRDRFDVGYGLCFGHNERKAIAMAVLDITIERYPETEQELLGTIDGLDASGFLEHLKLPHYVTFRSMVERKLAQRRAQPPSAPADHDHGDGRGHLHGEHGGEAHRHEGGAHEHSHDHGHDHDHPHDHGTSLLVPQGGEA